jgi:hypothetical protein
VETEKFIETDILNYLNTLPWCYAFKLNNVGVFDPVKKVYRLPRSRHIVRGMSDIGGVYCSKEDYYNEKSEGRALFIEVKTPKTYKAFMNVVNNPHSLNKTNIHYLRQWVFLDKIKKCGGIAFVSDGVKRTKDEIEKATGGNKDSFKKYEKEM